MKKPKKTLKALSVVIVPILTSCSLVTVKNPPLPLPDEPILVKIQPEELQCLSDATYMKFLDRKLKRDDYEEQLRAVILSTHD